MGIWIGGREVGLSPGQTAGIVGGSYVVRPTGVSESKPYIPGTGSTSIMVEGGATAGRGGAGIGATTTVRRDQYGNIIGVRQVSPTGETVFERRTTPRGGYVEEGLPFGVQPRYAEIERTKSEIPLYRRRAEYRTEAKKTPVTISPTPTFRLPILPSYRYGLPTRTFTVLEGRTSQEYYKTYPFIPKKGTPRISEPLQSFGRNIFGQEQGEPQAGKTYRRDWFGTYKEVSPIKAKVTTKEHLEAIKTSDVYAPFFVAPGAFSSTSVLRGASLNIKPINLKKLGTKMFGSETFVSQKKAFGGVRYFIEPEISKPSPVIKKIPVAPVKKPRKVTVMDILLVQPSRQRQVQIQRPAESMWRQVIAKPTELKPMTDFEAIYQKQAVQRIQQYTMLSKVAKPTPQVTVAKPIKTYGVMEYLKSKQQYRYSPQAFRPALRTTTRTQYIFMSGWANALGSLSGLMQGQRQEQRLGQLFGQQQAQAQKQKFRQRFAYDYTFKFPEPTKIKMPEYTKTDITTTKYPFSNIQPPKTPPKLPPREPPLFRPPPKIPKFYIPQFEMADILGNGRRRKGRIKEKVIVTRMLQLSDIFGNRRKR